MLMTIQKHPTFAPRDFRIRSPPYRVTRIGWGYFTINIAVVLKRGYIWQNENSRVLKLEWELDFERFGSSASSEHAVLVTSPNESTTLPLDAVFELP